MEYLGGVAAVGPGSQLFDASRGSYEMVFAMDAFFDASHLQRSGMREAFLIAGFLFKKDGLNRFEEEWPSRIANLEGPFRTSQCNAARGAFRLIEEPFRNAMLRDLADLIGKTRDMGFVAIVERDQYEDFRRTNPTMVRSEGSPYTLALLSIIDNASQYMKENYADENIYYWFEGWHRERERDQRIHSEDR